MVTILILQSIKNINQINQPNMYVPILKSKAGEFQAIKELAADVRGKILPLFDVTDLPWDYENDGPAISIDAHLNKLIGNLTLNYGNEHDLLLDLPDSMQDSAAGGKHALAYTFELGSKNQLKMIPVFGLDRPESYLSAVKEITQTDRRGATLRLEASKLTNKEVSKDIERLLTFMNLPASEVHLVLDFESIIPGQENIIFLAFNQVLALIPKITEWKSITFAGTAFPKDLSGIGGDSVTRIPRTEWLAWQLIHGQQAQLPAKIGFGDYTICHPEINEIDPRIMTMSANIRYTAPVDWIVRKGRGVKKNGFSQFVTLSQALIAMPDYRGETFCSGDLFISDCAKGATGTGNAQIWRKVGVNHHIMTVVDQLSKIGAV